MPGRQLITLTTDFGYKDPFVGVMKGVILKISPEAEIIDLTHGIRPHDIVEAAYTIGMNFQYFPDETLHVVVVDPGVGSSRRPIFALSNHHFFLGPDNGVFSYIYGMEHEALSVIHVTADHYFLKKRSPTFQGRDVFAPIAAWFSRGVRMEKFGEPITDYEKVALPRPVVIPGGEVQGEIIITDGFGNAITNISQDDIDIACGAGAKDDCKVIFRGSEMPLKEFYAEGDKGSLCSVVNSSGLLEFFVYGGNAADVSGAAVGEKVTVVLRK